MHTLGNKQSHLYNTRTVLFLYLLGASHTVICSGVNVIDHTLLVQVKASPDNSENDAYFCQITKGAQEISSVLGQVAADAVKSAYGQAAVDAVHACQSTPGSW